MCNAANKIITATLAVTAMLAASCAGSGEKALTAADSLAIQAKTAYENGDCMLAKTLIDSLNNAYPKAVEARREVTGIMPQVMLGYVQALIPEADRELAEAQAEADALNPLMKHVEEEDGSGYFVVADADGAYEIQPRVDDSLYTYIIVARNNGKAVGLSEVGLVSDAGTCAVQIPAGSDRAISEGGTEMAILIDDDAETLGKWAAENGPVSSAYLAGSAGRRTIGLTPQKAAAFATAWRFARVRDRLRTASIRREKLERQLQVATEQCRW